EPADGLSNAFEVALLAELAVGLCGRSVDAQDENVETRLQDRGSSLTVEKVDVRGHLHDADTGFLRMGDHVRQLAIEKRLTVVPERDVAHLRRDLLDDAIEALERHLRKRLDLAGARGTGRTREVAEIRRLDHSRLGTTGRELGEVAHQLR